METTEYSVAMTAHVDEDAQRHLLQHVKLGKRQEELCFGLWRPSQGSFRQTSLLYSLLFPQAGERSLQGNVAFTAEYLERAVATARAQKAGLAVLHSHLGPGFQGMSPDDVNAEQGRAARVLAGTELPLLGMTLATDGAWSARLWPRTAPKTYSRKWCATVRSVGLQLRTTYHPELRPRPKFRDELRRTISVWGEAAQRDLMRLRVGVVGVGSVGRMIAEGLARMGVDRPVFIDFDRVELHNLDRLLGAYREDAERRRLKVELAREGYMRASNAADPDPHAVAESMCELPGLRAALDCDVLFSCVDRPWPRRVLNHLAYAHLIPVIDGGIIARMRGKAFRGAEWSLRTAGPGRACLACAGAYNPSLVDAERNGDLDDPSYLQGLDEDHPLRRNENVFPFSMSLAAHELLQFCALTAGVLKLPDFGEQRYHYNLREMLAQKLQCRDTCDFPGLIATGDSIYSAESITGLHGAAQAARDAAPQPTSSAPPPRQSWLRATFAGLLKPFR